MWYVTTRTGRVIDLDGLLESNKALRSEVSRLRRYGCAVSFIDRDENGYCICNECGAGVDYDDNYCPYCGRKFIEEERRGA